MRRVNKHLVGEGENFVVQAVIEHARKLRGIVALGEIGAAYVSQEKRVTGQNRPGRGGFLLVCNYEAHALLRMARGFERSDAHLSNLQLETVFDCYMRESRAGLGSNVDTRAGSLGEPLVSGNEVSVQVCLEDVSNGNTTLVGSLKVNLDITLRIDYHRFPL